MSSDFSVKKTIEEIIPILENQLSKGKTRIIITPIEQLVGVNKTYRCNMEIISGICASNEFIIIKFNPKKPPNNKTQPINVREDLEDYSKRFNNEAAALTYLNSIQFPNKIHPTLIHQDIKNQLIVTRDMGKNPTVIDILNTTHLQEPETYLKNYVNLFAELHKHTINNWQRFKETQKQFSASSPLSDSTMDFRNNFSDFRALLDYIDSRYPLDDKESIIKEFNHIEKTVFDPTNPLYGFIHADSGIQNVNVDLESKKMVLFDYEFADTGYVLLDIAGLFLGFPQSGKGKRIPSRYYDMLIQEYSNSLSLTSEKLKESLVYALIHWTIGRIIGLWMFYLKPHIDDLNKVEIGFLNKTFTSNHECLNFLEKDIQNIHLRDFIEVIQLFISETWENIELVDCFPSFIDLS